jgi:hypothetical protein
VQRILKCIPSRYFGIYLKRSTLIFGMKIIHPIIKEIIVERRTADADISLIFFIAG